MRSIAFFLLFVVPLLANAEVVIKAWARATPPGATTGAIYGSFLNNGQMDREVVKINFYGARHVMVHRTMQEGGMSRMAHGIIRISSGEVFHLAPGGLHIMLMGISKPLVSGCRYAFDITWKDGHVTNHEFLTGSFGQMTMPDDDREAVQCH